MKVATKNKIKDWFIITRIRFLNFVKEHKYISAGIGVFLMSAIVALIVRAATNVDVNDATVNLEKTTINVNGSTNDANVSTFSEAIYTLNYTLIHDKCGRKDENGNDLVLYSPKVTITATLPEGTDTKNIKWIANEEAVSASVSDDNRTLTIVDENVNVCSEQHQNISLQILNVGKINDQFQTVKPTIKIKGGSASEEQSIESIPNVTMTYDEELDLKVKLRSGIAKFESATKRNANFGVLVGVDSLAEIKTLKGKHIKDQANIFLLASQADTAGESAKYLDISTDASKYGPYDHNKYRYFTNSNVPDLNTPAETIAGFEKTNYKLPGDAKTTTAPKVTLTNVPSDGETIEFEKYPVSVKYADDSKIKIGDLAEALCNGRNCEKTMHVKGEATTIDDIDLSVVNENKEAEDYEIKYSVGSKQSAQTTVIKKIKVKDVPENRKYSLEGPLTTYVLKDNSGFTPYGLYDIENKKKAVLNTDYEISYVNKDKTPVTQEQMLSQTGEYIQKYTIKTDDETAPAEVIERTIKVVDSMPSIISSDKDISVTDDYVSIGTEKYDDPGYKLGEENKKCSESNNCEFSPTTIDTKSTGERKITYTINKGNVITTIVKTVTVTPQYYKLSIHDLVSSGNVTRIDGGNFYAIGSYFITVPSLREENDERDFNIKLEAFDEIIGKVSEATILNRLNATGESDSKVTNTFYVNESSSMVPVTNPLPGAEKNGLKGDYYTAAMGEDVEMRSVFEYAYDADTNIDKLEVNIPVNSNLLPIGYDSSTFKYYNLSASLDGKKSEAEPKVTVSYCKSSDNEDCFEPTPENYTDSTMIINHINITIEENTYKVEENGTEVEKKFEINPGTIVELKTKYRVRTISGTSPNALDLSNLKFNGQVKFQWTNSKNNRIIVIPNPNNEETKGQQYATTPDIYITPYKARTSVGIGRNDKFNYNDITIDASKNDVYTVYASPDVISPAMNIQSNIFGYNNISSMKITFELPEGVTYVYNKNYTTYTPQVSSNGRILTYTITNIEPNSWIEPIYFDFNVDVTKANSTLETGETGFKLITHIGDYDPNNEGKVDKSISNDVSSIDYKKTTINKVRIENTEPVSYGQYISSNGKGISNIDIEDSFEISTKLHNNTDNGVTNLSVITVLPYKDDVNGASFNGTYQLNTLPENAFCTSDSVGMITNGDDVDKVNWVSCSDFKTKDNTYSNLTAYKVEYDSLSTEDKIATAGITTIGNKPDDSYTFKSFLMYTKADGTKSSYIGFRDITLDVVSKKITGVVWEDFDADGIMDKDEKKLSNVTLKLYDEEDNLKSTVTPNDDGVYTFSAVTEGNYYVVAEFNTDKYGVTGAPSEDFYDQTKLSVFREIKLTKEELEQLGVTNQNGNSSTTDDEEEDEYQETEEDENDTGIDEEEGEESEDSSTIEEKEMNIVKTDLISIGSETRIVRNINLGLSLRKKFKVQVNKYITRAEVTNALGVVTKKDYGNTKLAKLDVKDINNLKIKVIYTIELQNVKYYPGYVSLITEQIPDGMSFNPEYSENKGWEQTEEGTLINRTLANELIYENEKKYLTVAFDITRKEAGSFVNYASVDELEVLGGGKGEED